MVVRKAFPYLNWFNVLAKPPDPINCRIHKFRYEAYFWLCSLRPEANMFAKNLSVALKNRDIIVNPINPGYTKTDMGEENAHIKVPFTMKGIIRQNESKQ